MVFYLVFFCILFYFFCLRFPLIVVVVVHFLTVASIEHMYSKKQTLIRIELKKTFATFNFYT